MKTTLLHLEPHDDLISIRDRMGWAKTPRILLVWPRRARVEISPLDLILLRRHAVTLGAQLALVTRAGAIRQAARAQAIPCFSSLPKAQSQPWPQAADGFFQPPSRPKIDLRRLRAALPVEPFSLSTPARVGVFSTGVAALLLIFLLFLPAAQIHLVTRPQPQQIDLPVRADPAVSAVRLAGQIPSRPLTLILEASALAPASGQITLPDARAEAEVSLANLGAVPVTLPAGPIFLTRSSPPVAFESLEPVSVEKTAQTRVRALQGGEAGNVPAGAIGAFQDALGLTLTVTNLQPASGGSQIIRPAPSQTDLATLRKKMLTEMRQQAAGQFSAQLKEGDLLLMESIQPAEILLEEASPAPGVAAPSLSLRLRVRFQAWYAAQSDLAALAVAALDATLPLGYAPRPASLELTALSVPQADGVAYRWRMRAARAIQPRLDLAQAAFLARGQSPRRAAELLQAAFALDEAPAIITQPVWWPWLPILPMRITVTTNFP